MAPTQAHRAHPPEAVAWFDSPFGPLVGQSMGELVTALAFTASAPPELHPPAWPSTQGRAGVLEQLGDELAAYWAGEALAFTVALDWSRVGGFRHDVLVATAQIPYGRTTTYGGLAERVGRVGQARAVGGVLRSNPWVIVVGCHRVLGADGALTGYGGGPTTGGRLDVKASLLALEAEWNEPTLFGAGLG